MKMLAAAILLALAALAGYFYVLGGTPPAALPEQAATTTPAAETATTSTEGKLPGHEYAWSFKELPADESGMPKTVVMLSVDGGEQREVGTYGGTCFAIEGSSWELLEREHSGAICYFAGGGTEVGVFEEDNAMVVKQGVVDEGSAQIPGTRGDFKTLFAL